VGDVLWDTLAQHVSGKTLSKREFREEKQTGETTLRWTVRTELPLPFGWATKQAKISKSFFMHVKRT